MKKGSIVNNSYIFEHIFILINAYSCCAVCSLVKSKSYDGSDKASRV